MKNKFKALFFLFFLVAQCFVAAQNQHSPFQGSIHLGTGLGTIIDFKSNNNGVSMPYQIGIGTSKYINSESFIQFGFTLSRRGSRYFDKIEYEFSESKSWYRLTLLYLDLPVSYHTNINWMNWHNSFLFFGLNNSRLLKPPTYNGLLDVEDEFFRNFNFSLFAGISVHKHKNIQWNFRINQSVISVLKPEYKQEVEVNNGAYGFRIYPIEFIISLAFVLN